MNTQTPIELKLEAAGLKQVTLADMVGWNPQKVNRIVKGRVRAGVEEIAALDRATDGALNYELFRDFYLTQGGSDKQNKA